VAGIVALDWLEPKSVVKLPSSGGAEVARVRLLSFGWAVAEFRNTLAILMDAIRPNKAKINKIFMNLQ